MISVLHVTDSFGGGVAAAIDSYAKYSGVQHLLVGRERAGSEMSIDVQHFQRVVAKTSRAGFLRAVYSELKRGHDVVHLHSSMAGLARLGPLGGALTVYSPHALSVGDNRKPHIRRVARAVESLLVPRTGTFAAVGVGEALEIENFAKQRVPTVVIPHAIGVVEPLPTEHRNKTILSVGRVCYQKGPDTVWNLPLVAKEHGRLDGYTFVWVGDGDAGMVEQLKRGGWDVTGWLPRQDAMSRVASARAVVHPARYEGMPLAVLEAMGHGTPVAARSIRAYRDLDGPLYFSTEEQLLSTLEELCGSDLAWRSASARGLQTVRSEFSRSRQDRALEDLYRRGADHAVKPE